MMTFMHISICRHVRLYRGVFCSDGHVSNQLGLVDSR